MKTTENIWLEYRKKLSNFIRSKVADEAVDDLLQDIFLKIHSRLHTLKDDQKLESWIFQIARNAIIDHYRTRRSFEALPEWLEQLPQDTENTAAKELSVGLQEMIFQLPEKYQRAIQLSEIEGKTQKEVAHIEGLSLSGAKSRVQRGRALLKTMLNDCCEIELNRSNQVVAYTGKVNCCKRCNC